jgi:hypothetical protein
MLTLEQASKAVFPAPAPSAWHHHNETDRIHALVRASTALAHMELLGLECGVFGSALRPGDFFHNSDVDMVAWLPQLEPIGHELALGARIECHRAMGELPFDLVLLPCSNEAFGQRIISKWARRREDVERSSRGEALRCPLNFGPQDVAFIDKDRLDIASRAAQRMASAASECSVTERSVLSLCASMQTIARVAEKCAKDVLREFAHIQPQRHDPRPLYPLLAFPCQALGGYSMASAASIDLYFECCALLDPPCPTAISDPKKLHAWASRMALVATLFCSSMRADFEPALAQMTCMPSLQSQSASLQETLSSIIADPSAWTLA